MNGRPGPMEGFRLAHWSPLDWMFLGYSAMWALIVLYVGNLQRRQASVQREVAALRAALDEGTATGVATEPSAALPASR